MSANTNLTDDSLEFKSGASVVSSIIQASDIALTTSSGNILVDNQNATGVITQKLGATGTGSKFVIADSAGANCFQVFGDKEVMANGTFYSINSELAVSGATYTFAATDIHKTIVRDSGSATPISVTDTLPTPAAIRGAVADPQEGLHFFWTIYTVNSATLKMQDYTIDFTNGCYYDFEPATTVQFQPGVTHFFEVTLIDRSGVLIPNFNHLGESFVVPEGNSGAIQWNNQEAFAGTSGFSTDGTHLSFDDNSELRIGTGNDLTIVHDATDSKMTSTTGNLVVDNTNATGNTVFKLGDAAAVTKVSVQDSTSTEVFKVNSDGQVTCTLLTVTSDRNAKEDIEEIQNGLQSLDSIIPKSYKLKGEDTRRYGVIAQDLQENGLESLVQGEDKLSVDYNSLIGILLGSVKELKEKVEILEQNLV